VNNLLSNLRRALYALSLLSFLSPAFLFGQSSSPTLSGQVFDPSGAAVPAISVSVTGPGGTTLVVQTDGQGRYAFRNLPPGAYRLEIQVKGFADFVKTAIVIARGQLQVVDAHLVVALEKEEVTVTGESTTLSVAPSENASSLVIKGKDLEALSDDPDELQSELEALAGPSAGPNGGQIYIDGFTGGQLPAKSSIREIRVNQNPFSAQYDTLGYGRIEVYTKPGTDKLHGQAFISGNDSAFNTRNPFASEIPAYHTELFDGNIGGPLSRKASFYFDGQRRDIGDDAVVSAVALDSSLNPVSLSQTLPTPRTRTNLSPRIDTQIGTNNTLTMRYQYWRDTEINQGVGQFALPSQAYNTHETDQSIQVSDAQVLSEKAVTEIRFQYHRSDSSQNPQNFASTASVLGAFEDGGINPGTGSHLPTVSVLGAFTDGGNNFGTGSNLQNSYEGQSYTSVSLSKHFLKFGARLRDSSQAYSVTSNFNGTFTFPSLSAYQAAAQALQKCKGQTSCQASGEASQFSIVELPPVTGTPLVNVHYLDLEPYAEDDWKVRPNMSLSAGLRFETQNVIHDHTDFAPRLGFAWGLGKGKSPKTVLRAGFGVFYDRFTQSLILNAERLSGVYQQQYIINSPDSFPTFPALSTPPTTYQIDPNLRAPYTTQAGVGLERQVAKNVTVSVTYLNTHGVHQLLSRNINAPLPGTYDPADPTSGVRPFPALGNANLYQYESAGLYNQNQLISNFRINRSKISLFGFYTLGFANSNTAGASSFPMDQYDLAEDYGRAAYDVRQRLFLGGSWNLPRGFQIFPFVVVNSAPPFNITVGQDLNGNSIEPSNNRPAFATDLSRPSVIFTQWGTFDTSPTTGQTIIPPNYGTGFDQFTVNLRLSKTFGFGKELSQPGGFGGRGGGGPRGGRGGGLGPQGLSGGGGGGLFSFGNSTNRRYNLTLSLSARNIFNNVNLASPVGVLGSPLFGQANSIASFFGPSSAANRRIDLQARFTF
jgi:hypothetical protein